MLSIRTQPNLGIILNKQITQTAHKHQYTQDKKAKLRLLAIHDGSCY